jgi:hypothetical protein
MFRDISFQDTHRRQMAQAIKLSSHGRLVVTNHFRSGLHPFQEHRRMKFSRTRLNRSNINRYGNCLKGCHVIFDSPGRDCI